MSAILFKLGETVLTPGAQDLLDENCQSAREYLLKHAQGDWGDMSDEDKAINERAVIEGGRLVSQYWVGVERLHVITEADRSVTTLLLPEEY